jgi:hypothetical protein
MRFSKAFILFLFLVFHCSWAFGQDTIFLLNPSFEGNPARGEISNRLDGWTDCGRINFPGQSPPDVHPTPDSAWGVTMEAFDGLTYLGLVTRYDDTYESISQKLSRPLKSGRCYKLSGYFSLSETYQSVTRRSFDSSRGVPMIQNGKKRKQVSWSYWLTHDEENLIIVKDEPVPEDFSHPVELLIWGGFENCKRNQLYVHSGPINQHTWTPFTLEFSPDDNHDHITIGAFFEYGYAAPYNGHLLIDGLSPIIEIPCKD